MSTSKNDAPWKVKGRTVETADGTYTICEAPKRSAALLGHYGYEAAMEADRRNLAFIATACNVHEDLVDALLSAMCFVEDIEEGEDGSSYKPGSVKEALKKIRAVLVKAGAITPRPQS